jgi:hypothetical protein
MIASRQGDAVKNTAVSGKDKFSMEQKPDTGGIRVKGWAKKGI